MLNKKQEAISEVELIIDMIQQRISLSEFYGNDNIPIVSIKADIIHLQNVKELIENI